MTPTGITSLNGSEKSLRRPRPLVGLEIGDVVKAPAKTGMV